MSFSRKSCSAVVIDLPCLFSSLGSSDTSKVQPMAHAAEVLQFLHDKDIRLVVRDTDSPQARNKLRQFQMEALFMVDNQFQGIKARWETQRDQDLQMGPQTYYRDLKGLGFETLDGVSAVTDTVDGFKIGRASGVKSVFGFYGSPDISIGNVIGHRDGLERWANWPQGNSSHVPIATFSNL